MGKWLMIGVALVSSYSFAATMDLDFNIKHKKNSITRTTNSSINVTLGKPFTLKTQDMEVILTATEEGLKSYSGNSKSTLSIEGQIFHLENGTKKLISSQKVVGSFDNPVELISKDNFGNELYLSIQTASLID